MERRQNDYKNIDGAIYSDLLEAVRRGG
jgi:hypothetical protein